MLIVTGSARIKADQLSRAQQLSREHVRQSREEPGCLSHSVHIDAEVPERLFFFEEWADREALLAHFEKPRCRDFAARLTALCDGAPALRVYEAELAST